MAWFGELSSTQVCDIDPTLVFPKPLGTLSLHTTDVFVLGRYFEGRLKRE